MSTLFNEENFLKKLDSVLPTQDSVQSLSLWVIHNKTHYEAITKNWFKKLKESTNSKQSLSLFYLANDVIQNCKRKNAKVFLDAFKPYISEGVMLVDSSIKPNIERIVNVWKERNVYENEYLDKLNELLSVNVKKPEEEEVTNKELEIQKLISEFQPKKLCETINKYSVLEKDVMSKKTSIESSRVLEVNIEHIKQYRDKTQCTKFFNEYENSVSKLEEYTKHLEAQINERQALINLLEQSEIFYDAQYKDAKLVVNAYRVFGTKVHLVQKKLDEILENRSGNYNQMNSNDVKLDNLDMEMSDDDDVNIKGLPIPTISGSQTSVRTALDPRQNRSSQQNSYHPSYLGNVQSQTHSTKMKNESLTPVKDETMMDHNASKNPLAFLTKFINKSSVASTNNGNHSSTGNSVNTNNNIISSLQRYVCTSNSTFMNNNQMATTPMSKAYDPREYNYEGYYNDDLYNEDEIAHDGLKLKRQRSIYDPNTANNNSSTAASNNIFINPLITSQNRSVTPTKDELYQNGDSHSSQYPHFNLNQTQPVPSHLSQPPSASMMIPPNDHLMAGYNYIPPFNNPLLQAPPIPSALIHSQQTQASAVPTQISPTAPPVPYMPHHNQYANPHQPTMIPNYQKQLSNNININTNESKNEDSMKRKYSNDGVYEQSSSGNINKKHNYTNNSNNQKSFQHIPTISSHRNDTNISNNANNLNKNFSKYTNQQQQRHGHYYHHQAQNHNRY